MVMSSPNYNTHFPSNFTPTGASNNFRYPHNESTLTSAPLRKTFVEQSILDRCTITPNPREYRSDDSFSSQTIVTVPYQLSSRHQTIYGAHSQRQHGEMGRSRCTSTQGSPLPFPTPLINHIRVPSVRMRLSQGNNGNGTYAMNGYTFPNSTYNVVQAQDQHVFSGANRGPNDVQQQHTETSILGKKPSSVGEMGVGYGFSHANVKFNNRQYSHSFSSPRNTGKRSCVRAYNTAQGQSQTQSSSKRHSMYSPSVSVDGTRWHCNGCEYIAEREQDMIRHCSTLRHGGRRLFACPTCRKEFSRKDSVTRHSKKTGCGLRRAPLLGSSA